jgi:hypothetical protein
MPPDEGNDLGHWESNTIVAFNERLLASAGSKWDDWLPLNKGWNKSAVRSAFLAEGRDVLRSEYANSPLFVLKDPRICRLAAIWLEVIEDLRIRPVIAFPLRNPYEVSNSLAQRDGSDQGFGLLLWLRHVLEAEAATRQLARHFFSFDQLLSDWTGVVDGFEREAGLRFPRRSVSVEAEISAFLTEDAWHQRSAPSVGLSADVPVWVRDTYAILQRWCNTGVQSDDFGRLDEIRAEFDAASPSFARIIAGGVNIGGGFGAGAQKREELERLQHEEANGARARAELAEMCEELERLRDEEADGAQALVALAQKFDGVSDANRRMEAELAELGSAMRQRQEEAAQAWAQANTEQKLREQVEAEQQRLIRQNEQLIASLSVIDERIRADNKALASARRRASDAEAAMRLLTRQHEKLLSDMETQGAELERARTRSARADSELAQLAMLHMNAQEQMRALEETASRVQAAEEGGHQARTLLEDRQSEVLALKEMLARELTQADAMKKQAEWLQEATVVLQRKPALRMIFSSAARKRYSKALLKASSIFDAEAYLAKNPDVAESGDDPFLHYIRHGLREGRTW